ncbi:hypothetical protein ABK040_013452 [Willaertia magna]
MKYHLPITVALFLLSALLLTSFTIADFGYVKPTIPQCKRVVTVDNNSKKTLKFQSKLECEASFLNKTKTEVYTGTSFTANINKVPFFKFISTSGVEISLGVGKPIQVEIKVGAAFGIDKIIEFDDRNGVPGYQPNSNDTIVNTWTLNDKVFTDFTITKTDVSNDGTSYVYKLEGSVTITGLGTIRITAYVTSEEVSYSNNDLVIRNVKQILTPYSMKTEISIEGVKYSKPTTRLAIGSFVIYRGSVSSKKTTTRNILATSERPEDPSNDQKVFNFDSDIIDQALGQVLGLPKPFFSFQTFVASKVSTAIQKKTLISTDLLDETILNLGDATSEISNAKSKRIWFSLAEQIENLNWDPSIGNEGATVTNSASRMISGVFIPLILNNKLRQLIATEVLIQFVDFKQIIVIDKKLDENILLNSLSKILIKFSSFSSEIIQKINKNKSKIYFLKENEIPNLEVKIARNEDFEWNKTFWESVSPTDNLLHEEFLTYKKGKLITIQITFTKNHTIIGMVVNHALCDQHGIYLFCKAWTEAILKNNEFKSLSKENIPNLERFELLNLKENKNVISKSDLTNMEGIYGIIKWFTKNKIYNKNLYNFTTIDINKIKTTIYKQLNHNQIDDINNFYITTNDILIGLLLKSFALGNPNYSNNQFLQIIFTLNVRELCSYVKDKNYFGNAQLALCIKKTKGEIIETKLSELIKEIHNFVMKSKRNENNWMENNFKKEHIKMLYYPNEFESTFVLGNVNYTMVVSNWCRYNMFDLRFDNDNNTKVITAIPLIESTVPHIGFIAQTLEDTISLCIGLNEREGKSLENLILTLHNDL